VILVLTQDCPPDGVERILQHLRQLGAAGRLIQTGQRALIAFEEIGDIAVDVLEGLPGVQWVVPTAAEESPGRESLPRMPATLELRPGVVVGGQRLAILAGPCSVESEAQLLAVAQAARDAGAVGLRGGAFKPRTNPYSFQGLGEQALEMLALAREATGLAVVTEVMAAEQVDLVARYADVLQIGTRNMHNFSLLSAVGQAGKPVLLKRGWSATLEEWLHAAEYVLHAGSSRILLCERGIRTFERYVRNTLALAVVPAAKQRSPLPVLVDPSQGTGVAELVAPMSKAAVACGADGLLIEVHPDPSRAVTDGPQSIDIPTFQALMADLKMVANAVGRSI
jgi:3-deoxy-7-phosphoheptulonate synthase